MGAKNSRPQQPPAFQEDWTPIRPIRQYNLRVQEAQISNTQQIGNNDLPIEETDLWKKYYGTVIGTPQEVREALKLLGREPMNSNELCQAIYHWRRIESANFDNEYEYA